MSSTLVGLDELDQDDEQRQQDGDTSGAADQQPNEQNENVSVAIRCRPLIGQAELASCQQARSATTNGAGDQSVQVDEARKCVQVQEREFCFDQVFGPSSTNEMVYMKSIRKLVESSFNGFNCTIFMYGQTGTGKTFTHSHLTGSAFEHLFSLISDCKTRAKFLIRASYYELYNETFRDLLSKSGKALELRESKARGVYVKDLSCFLVNNLHDLEKLKRIGDKRRTTAATKMNEHSSRSHSIFSITIEQTDDDGGDVADEELDGHNVASSSVNSNSTSASSSSSSRSGSKLKPKSNNNNIEKAARQARQTTTNKTKQQKKQQPVRLGRLHLIDLAGSERQSKSGSQGQRLKEASQINLSLTCLSLVIRALTDKNSQHVPYRSSKLTRLLASSLGGNSKTLLIACISPAPLHLDETLNTLRFASRTKLIKNQAKINEDPKDALLRNYRQQISELRRKLQLKQQQQQQESNEAATGNTTNLDPQRQQEQPADSRDQQLMGQLKLLREKIMIGGENLLEKVEMHDRLIEASRLELEEKRKEEARLREKLAKKRELIEQMSKSKSSLECERANLDEKLKQVLSLYKRSKNEAKDLASEHEQLRGNLLQTIRATSKEIKYADCIIEDFIPREQLDLINTYARYDDESDEWQIKYIALSGNNIVQTRRLMEGKLVDQRQPTSEMATEEHQQAG